MELCSQTSQTTHPWISILHIKYEWNERLKKSNVCILYYDIEAFALWGTNGRCWCAAFISTCISTDYCYMWTSRSWSLMFKAPFLFKGAWRTQFEYLIWCNLDKKLNIQRLSKRGCDCKYFCFLPFDLCYGKLCIWFCEKLLWMSCGI